MTKPSEEIAAWLKDYGNKNATLPFYVLLAGPEVEPIVLPEVLTKEKLEEAVESAVEAMAAAK